MSKKKALLVEIIHPESDTLHRIMCGPGFTFLRRETDGRDLFGLTHKGEEYLFFPLGFTFHSPTTIALTEPLGAEFFHRNMHGARVTFKALRGLPFFENAPRDFFQSSGTLSFNEHGDVFVELEEFVPWEKYDALAEEEEELHQEPPPPRRAVADHHDHHHDRHHDHHYHHGDCCHGHDHHEHGHHHHHDHMRAPSLKVTSMTDQEHVEAVVAASRVLNIALRRAAMDGVETRLLLTEEQGHDSVAISRIQRTTVLWKNDA